MGEDLNPETSGFQASLLTIRPRVCLVYYSEAYPTLPRHLSLNV
jgi:hypothetical protein